MSESPQPEDEIEANRPPRTTPSNYDMQVIYTDAEESEATMTQPLNSKKTKCKL